MAEALVGLRVAAPAFLQPQRHRGRLLPAARLGPFRGGRLCTARAAVAGPPEVDEDEAMSIDNLHRFFDLNVGKWDGSFFVRPALPRFTSSFLCSLSICALTECCACLPVLAFCVAIRRAREGSAGD